MSTVLHRASRIEPGFGSDELERGRGLGVAGHGLALVSYLGESARLFQLTVGDH